MMILQKQKLLFGGIALFLSGCLATSQKGPQADCPDGSIDNGKGQCLVASSQVQKLEKELSTSDVLTQERLKKLGLYRTEEECRKSEADELCRAFFFRETHQRIKAYNSMQPCVAGEYNWLEKRGIRTPGSSRELIFNAGEIGRAHV